MNTQSPELSPLLLSLKQGPRWKLKRVCQTLGMTPKQSQRHPVHLYEFLGSLEPEAVEQAIAIVESQPPRSTVQVQIVPVHKSGTFVYRPL